MYAEFNVKRTNWQVGRSEGLDGFCYISCDGLSGQSPSDSPI